MLSKTQLLYNVLRIKPEATPDDVRRIAPALAEVTEAELVDWMSRARGRIAKERQVG